MKIKKNHEGFFGLDFVLTGDETEGRYFLSLSTVPGGDAGPPQHVHEKEDEVFYIIEGQMIFQVDGKSHHLEAGDFLVIEKGEIHSWQNPEKTEAKMLVIFSPAGIEQMFVKLAHDPFKMEEIGKAFGTRFFLDED